MIVLLFLGSAFIRGHAFEQISPSNVTSIRRQDKMDNAGPTQLDPGLLQAVLADPVLLQAVDPQVLQAVLVSAAAVNLGQEEEKDLNEFEEIKLPQPQQQQSQQQIELQQQQQDRQPKQAPGFLNSGQTFGFGAKAQSGPTKFGGSFSDISGNINPFGAAPQFNGLQNRNLFERGQFPSNNQVRNPFGGGLGSNNNIFNNNNNNFNPNNNSPKSFGAAFNSPGDNVRTNAPSNEKSTGNIFASLPQASGGFPALPSTQFQPSGDDGINNKNRKTFGAPFGKSPSVIGPQNRPGPTISSQDPDVEVFSEKTQAGSASEKLRSLPDPELGTDPGLTEDSVLTYLRDNPDLLQQLGRLQLPPESGAKSEKQILPPVIPPGPGTPGACSLVTANGIPCDPGLAFSPLTGSCEWPDTLIETGCNPEVVTGFGPCPQHIEDPGLNPAQIYGWPYPKFPVTPDIVQAYGFDALLAKKYFVVCVPTVYEKLFPRLICCPDHEFFDPFHVDGCVHPLPPPPPRPTYLPPPFK